MNSSSVRLISMQSAMAEHELDALLLTDRANFEYVSSFLLPPLWSSYTRTLAAVVPATGQPVLLVPEFVADEAHAISSLPVHGYERIDRRPVNELAAMLRELAPAAGGRVGIERSGETRLGMAVDDLAELERLAPHLRFVDGSTAIWQARMIKTADEIEIMRLAGGAAAQAFGAALRQSREGQTEAAVAADLAAGVAGAKLERGTASVGWLAATSGAGNYGRFVGPPRARNLSRGEMLWFDLGVVVEGYWSDFCRAGVVGGPSAQQLERHRRICDATGLGVSLARPGTRVSAVALALRDRLTQLGLPSLEFGRMGHGLGRAATEPPSVAGWDDTVLELNMVITIEPAAVLDDGLYCAEQVVRVDDPPEILSLCPSELAVI
jgi:Xaa-Pro aminopeptidase